VWDCSINYWLWFRKTSHKPTYIPKRALKIGQWWKKLSQKNWKPSQGKIRPQFCGEEELDGNSTTFKFQGCHTFFASPTCWFKTIISLTSC